MTTLTQKHWATKRVSLYFIEFQANKKYKPE